MGTLTIIRVPIAGDMDQADLTRSTGWYPFVGIVVGFIPAAILTLPIPSAIGSAIALVAWILVTGALHLDGLADCADAAFAPRRFSTDRGDNDAKSEASWRRSILKDPHIGSFGVVALILGLLLKWTALTTVSFVAPVVAAVLARYGAVYILSRFPPARTDGLAAAFGAKAANQIAIFGTIIIGAVLIARFPTDWIRVIASGMLAISTVVLLGKYLSKKFDGVTGDVCGAAIEITEVVVLLCWVPWGA